MINAVNPNVQNNNKKLSIFYTNDLHGNADNLGGLYSASKNFDKKVEEEKCDAIKLSAGDNYSGGDVNKNDMVMSMLMQMGIKYSAVGNHEFDAMGDKFAENIKNHDIKFVSSNLNIDNTNALKPLIQEAVIEEISGEKYGIVGFTTDELKDCATSPEAIQGIEVKQRELGIQQLQNQIDELKKQGVTKIIMVSHNGLEEDKKLVSEVSGIDIIISGHSHDTVQGARVGDNILTDKEGNPTIVVQTGENGKNYGVLDVIFDDKGNIKSVDNNVYKTPATNSPIVDHIKDSKMGKSPVIGNIKYIDPFPKNKRTEPCAWSNLLCDAMKTETGVEIAFMNSANIRKIPQTGKLTKRDVKETSPFENTVIKTTMTEKEIIEALKFGAKSLTAEAGIPGIIQVSGLEYKMDKQGNLLEVNFVDKNGAKTAINVNNPTDKSYTVCYDSFMADGREYPPFDIKNRKNVEETKFLKDELLSNYISKMPENTKQNLEIKDDKRLQIV